MAESTNNSSQHDVAIRPDHFEIVGVRAVGFTPNRADFKSSAILAVTLGKYAKRYGDEVQSLPLPEEAPPHIPRILLKGGDGQWEFVASPASISSAWNAQSGSPPIKENLASLVSEVKGPIENLVIEGRARLGRLAIVITRACATPEPSDALIQRFCKPEVSGTESSDSPLRNSRNFELHNLKRYSSSFDAVEINSWVRCKTGQVDGKPAIVVEQDINTLAEAADKKVFDLREVTAFYEMAVAEAEQTLKKYFP